MSAGFSSVMQLEWAVDNFGYLNVLVFLFVATCVLRATINAAARGWLAWFEWVVFGNIVIIGCGSFIVNVI